MVGFLIGTACLIGLLKVLRAGRRGECGAGGCGAHRWHGGWHEHHSGWGASEVRGGGAFWLRGLFERLDTTPGQEKVIKQALDEVMAATSLARGELEQTRRDVANALRGGVLDETQMGEMFARHDDKLREVRKAFVGALAKVSDALDEDQRRRLADLLERGLGGRFGFGRFAGGGPYRRHSGNPWL